MKPDAERRRIPVPRAQCWPRRSVLVGIAAACLAVAVQLATMDARAQTAAGTVATAPSDTTARSVGDFSQDEVRDAHRVLMGSELTAADFPGSWPLFGTAFRMKFGGYVRVDALGDFAGTGDRYQFLISGIGVDGSPEALRAGYFNMFMRETRFNFDVRKTIADEPAQQVFLELDFFDESSTSPRLRHAYVVYGHLVLGQTWSTLVDLRSVVNTVDFAYGNVLYGGRPVQVRWQQSNDRWSWAAGIEMPSREGIANPDTLGGAESPVSPAVVGRITRDGDSGFVMLGGVAGTLRWDGEGAGPDATAAQWAVVVVGRRYIGSRDYVAWNLSYGDGTAEYITALAGSNANATLTGDGRLVTTRAVNLSLGYAHRLTESVSTNLAFAWTGLEANSLRAADEIRRGMVGHANVIWDANGAISTGIEYMWGRRENVDGASGDASRLQAMVKYSW